VSAEPVTASVFIEAEPGKVFEYFTQVEAMTTWLGPYAVLEPTTGGEFTVDIRGTPIRGRYVELQPPTRVVFTWGVAGSEVLPAGSSTVEVVLTGEQGGTRVELTHSGLPEPERPKHVHGWEYFFGQLAEMHSTRS
jgi:uncharacterized protein YndB with AHSA1/START domain